MTTLNRGSDIAAYLTTLLSQISKVNGYHTDIGRLVLRGRRKIDETHLPCVVIVEGEDKPQGKSGRFEVVLDQDYVIGGYDFCDPDNPNDQGHLIVKDIKKALWNRTTQGPNLGGRVKDCEYQGKDIGPRVDGEPMIFAVVHATIKFAETLDDA